MGEKAPSQCHGEEHIRTQESGIFTWDLDTNILQGDSAVAELFGLEASEVIAGLPIQDYIDRIVETDRPKVAQSIHHAIVTGDPYHEVYSVRGKDRVSEVVAFGRCFRDSEKNPSQYAGIVFRVTDGPIDGNAMAAHIAVAHKLAVEAENARVADALEAILEDLSKASKLETKH